MQDQGAHKQQPTEPNRRIDGRDPILPSIGGSSIQFARQVGAGQHPHWTVLHSAGIQVNPNRQHPLEDRSRRLHVRDPHLL